MGLCNSLRWSLIWIFLIVGLANDLTQGANVRRVYRRNGNYGRRIAATPQVSSVLQTPSRHFRAHDPLFVAEETRHAGSVIPQPSNRLRLPAVDRQDQLAEETESQGYSYPSAKGTTGKPGYAYKRPPPIAEITDDDKTEEVYETEIPQGVSPQVEAEYPDQEPAFGLVSTKEVDSEGLEPDRSPDPVADTPVAEFSDSDAKCNENDHDCWPHGYKGVIRGEAGTDYPILTEIIPTAFDCNDVKYSGYYADTDETARCQIFHICLRRNRHRKTQKWSFLCPNGTVFDQGNFVCVWWDMAPDCNRQTIEPLYDLNEALGWDNITETEFDVDSVMSAMGDSQMSRNLQDTLFQPSSSRLKNTIVDKPTTKRPSASRPRAKPKTHPPVQSRNSAYRIPIRVSDGARDRTALKPVTNNIGDYPEHDTDESSTYETSLRTEQNTEARFKTKSASALHKSQSEAYEEKSDPQAIRPFIVNNRRPYVDREEASTEAYDNNVPVVVMMPTRQRYPDGSEGVVNVPVIIMRKKSSQVKNTGGYQEAASNEAVPPRGGYLPPTEEYDPVEQPSAPTSAPQYLPPATEVIPPSTEETQYDQEIDQQPQQPVFTEDSNADTDEESEIDEGYQYSKPPRQILQNEPVEEVSTTESGYRYRRPTTTARQEEEEATTEGFGYKYKRPTTAEPDYSPQQEEATTTERDGYNYRRPTTREPEYIRQEEPEVSTQIAQEEYTTERSREYLPPKQETTATPAGGYLPPKHETTEPSVTTYVPPKQETAETSTAGPGYLPPKQESTTKSPGYLPPKQEQATEQVVAATDAPTTQEVPTTSASVSYLPPKTERVTTTQASNAYLPPKEQRPADSSTQEARTTTEAASPNAYLPPKAPEQISSDSKSSPSVTGRAITQKVASVAVEKPDNSVVLPGVDTKESSEETETEEQSSEEANEVTNPAKEDITEKYHLPTPSTPVVTPDSEDLGPPSQLYNANVRQQFLDKSKNGPVGYEENAESQEKINEIIRQLQAGVAEAEDSNGKKIDFAQFAKINAKIALVVPQRGVNGTTQTSQTLIFDTSTESVTEALKSIQSSASPTVVSSASPSLASPSPSSESLPFVETFIQNPFVNQDFSSINTPQYEINLPTKEFESHSVENSIEYDRKQNQGNQQQFSSQFSAAVSNSYPQVQVQQPQISNFIQPQIQNQNQNQNQNQAIQSPVLSTVVYNQPAQQPQNFILPISSPAPQQFNPQQLFFQSQSQPQQQTQILQEPLYSAPLPPSQPQQQQTNFVQQPQQQQNFVQQSPTPQQNFIQQIPQRNNFVVQAPQQQNFAQQQQQPQQNTYIPPQQEIFRSPPQQQADNIFRPPAPQQSDNIFRPPAPQQPEVFRAPAQQQQQQEIFRPPAPQNSDNIFRPPAPQQSDNIFNPPAPQQPGVFRSPAQRQPEIYRAPLHQQPQQQAFHSQPQQSIFNQNQGQGQQQQQRQSERENRYLPPGPQNFPEQNIFRHQQQFQQQLSQATFSHPQIVDFQAAKTPTLDITKPLKKVINPADIKIVPAIFVHHHSSVENPDGSPIPEENEPQQKQQPESRARNQQQSFTNSGFYERPQQNQFRNSNFLPFTAQQSETIQVAVSPPKSMTKPSLPPPPSPSNVFSRQDGLGTPQLEKFTLDDARTAEQVQQYHRENLKHFLPAKPTHPSSSVSTAFIGSGSSGRLDMSPEQSSIADASRFYPGRDNSLGVKLTYE